MRRRLLALVLGGLPALAFPEPSWWWFAWVALVPWLVLLSRTVDARDAAWCGWSGGLGFMLASHWWLLPNLLVFLPVVCAVLAVLWVPFGLAARAFLGASASWLAALVVVPSSWVLVELVRSVDRLGGPWALLGASQWNAPTLPLASIGGVWLLSFLVVLVNVVVTKVVLSRSRRAGLALVAAVGMLVVAVIGARAAASSAVEPDEVVVAAVQPGVVDDAERRFADGERLTRSLAGQDVDLVVWGESSVGFDLDARPDLVDRLSAVAAELGAPLLVNVDARSDERGGIAKASVLVTEDGVVARYDKSRLVPFGEYVPLRPFFGWASSVLEAAEQDRVPGAEPVVMDAGDFTIGPVVCFESAFPDLARTLAAEGADLLVVQAATSTFQDSWAPEQHASLAAVRATETGRPVVHSTLTGTTTAFGPSGERVGAPLSTDEVGVAVLRVPFGSGDTWFVRAGSAGTWVAVLVLSVGSFVIVWSVSRGVSAGRTGLRRGDPPLRGSRASQR